MKKVLVALSGGVDSSYTAHFLKKEYNVTGITLSLCGNEDMDSAKRTAQEMGIEHIVLDLKKEFKKYVTEPFKNSYLVGETPNPCVNCNKYIKFGLLYDYMLKEGYDFLATGHYARIEKENERFVLKKALDLSKDQSYMLYNLKEDMLSHILLPLGNSTKEEVKQRAEKNSLHSANKKESQDICFVDGRYKDFLNCSLKEGNFIDKDGNVLGRHKGIQNYTIGQRKGLEIALGKRMFVTKINIRDNTVTLGESGEEYFDNFYVRDYSFIGEEKEKFSCSVKVRYGKNEEKAEVIKENNLLKVIPQKKIRAVTSGQSAVFYDNEKVLGGGVICCP